jgi:nucleotide-binding universal stress UspA family protein
MSVSERINKMVQADWKKILVPVDFSKHCLPAVQLGQSLAQKYGAKLYLIHAVEMVYATGFEFASALPVEKDLLIHASEELKRVAKDNLAPGLDYETVVKNGQAYRTVVDYANEESIDLILVTTHGYTGLKHLALGSVAERIVRHSRVPVMVVPVSDNE